MCVYTFNMGSHGDAQIIVAQSQPDLIKQDAELGNQSTDESEEEDNEQVKNTFTTTIYANDDNTQCSSCTLGCTDDWHR